MKLLLPLLFYSLAYGGEATLAVDATHGKLLHARESISLAPGPHTLLYPKWIPGEHGPTGPVMDVAGLKITSGGSAVPWRRDLEEMYAIHFEIPPGASSVNLEFDFLLPAEKEGFSSGASSSAQLILLSWNQVVLYPSELSPDSLRVSASLKLPPGWKFATALETDYAAVDEAHFKPVSLTMLIDSPVLAGAHMRRIDISSGLATPHYLNIASDGEFSMEMPEYLVDKHRHLVLEANALFGAHHYSHYDFLYTLSDQVAHFGLEHHQSSDDRVEENTLADPNLWKIHSALLPHEFVHSWNGKYRRPAGLATGNYSSPMHGDLLWVYEGLTQYLGYLLAARSGLRSPDEYLQSLAFSAAALDRVPGRQWRPLQDAADEAQLLYNARAGWHAYRRGTDFYDEGNLIWLQADVKIRKLTGNRKSLDDFCKKFHGGLSTGPAVVTYTFDDVVAALNTVAPFTWAPFLSELLTGLSARAPLGGIESAGWRIVYRDSINPMQEAYEHARNVIDLRFSLGMMVDKNDGTLVDVIPESPASASGLQPGMTLVAVNSRRFSERILHNALKDARAASLDLLASDGDLVKNFRVSYRGGERYPWLERIPSTPDILSDIIRPLAARRK